MAGLATTIDHLLGGRVLLEQPVQGFRSAIDAVLLAAAVPRQSGDVVLDAGCGTGAASLCLARRRADLSVTGLEVAPEMAALAEANVLRNGLVERVKIEVGDLLAPPPAVRQQIFACVITNPPFNAASGWIPQRPARRLAMVEAEPIAVWLAGCFRRLATGGRLVMIHRADRLPAVLAALQPTASAIEIVPLWPVADGRPAKRVLVRCRKGGQGPAVLRQGLVLHAATGMFTEAAEAMLRHAAALDDVLPSS